MSIVNVLAAVRSEHSGRYQKHLSAHQDFRVQVVSAAQEVLTSLEDRARRVDVLVLDNGLGSVFELVEEVRHRHPRLFIILVDEDADFGFPGQADEISTEPFRDNDLIKRITRLMSDRHLETLRADSLPAIRQFAKELRNAYGENGKQEAAVRACRNLSYDYVSLYRIDPLRDGTLVLRAHEGPTAVKAIAPKSSNPDDLMNWVFHQGQSRMANSQDTPNHPLVAKERMRTVVCVPVTFSGEKFGVMAAFREESSSIHRDDVMLLELLAVQLAAAISKEQIGE
jgi:putative methionine-R-sulfoxide reductase with GAF domain